MAGILVVDDSFFQRKVVCDILKDLELEITEASSGLEAFELVKQNNYALIVLDLLMPEMNGLEFLEKFNELKSGTPVVVMTADIQKSTRDKCLKLGVAAFLNKMPDRSELLESVNDILNI